MKSMFSWLLAICLLGACSQSGPDERLKSEAGQAKATAGEAAAATAELRARSFADLPDRGDLTDYGSLARRSGAYTWHAARLSEAHAIGAVVTGEMVVAAPDGTPIRLQYDRHIEHENGNWTWVGSTVDGEQALITFGDSAAFGSIPQGRGRAPLRLTTRNGHAWVVSVDRDALAAVHNEATDPSSPDYFIPPKSIAGDASRLVGAPSVAAAPQAAAGSGQLLDLLVGYTQGFASSVGGQSAAHTRIQYLVDVTNQAYVNSRVALRIRLVHSMQVNYPDATDNGEALDELTGTTGSGPAPEFSELRAARDEYGADLVTLVRKFQTPENGGCGVAWLIGGGMTEIVPGYEYYGYSVVSDGQDGGSEGTYYCRDETLAHELGHNLGSQHDAGTASNEPGRYSYSYGYKATASSGDFFTIMAYGDSGQTAYRVFSNPRIDFCGGRACGSSTADVARSLAQTSPIVAAFRDSVELDRGKATARIDFDRDGRADILWRNQGNGSNVIWSEPHAMDDRRLATVANLSWFIAGTGDFDGDGATDLLWRDRDTGRNVVWRTGSAATTLPVTRVDNFDWSIAGVGDFDGDGRDDILWRNSRTGANTIWRSGSSETDMPVTRVNNFDWTIAAVADFDGDGRSDILWRNTASGDNTVWRSGNAATDARVTRVNNFDWQVAAAGDFDGDGRADILWRNLGSGANTIWLAGKSGSSQAVSSLPPGAWQVAGADDYDGDGRFDILWRNRDNGDNALWRSGSSSTLSPVTDVPNLTWQVEGSSVG